MHTEYEFTLPHGYIDETGAVHRQGRMRLATTLDEIEPVGDPQVQANPSYLPILLLPRVITRLGSLPEVTTQVMERLFAIDLAYLGDLYLRLNSPDSVVVQAMCPFCHGQYHLQVAPMHDMRDA